MGITIIFGLTVLISVLGSREIKRADQVSKTSVNKYNSKANLAEKSDIQEAVELWETICQNPDRYLGKDFTIRLRVSHKDSGGGYFSSWPGMSVHPHSEAQFSVSIVGGNYELRNGAEVRISPSEQAFREFEKIAQGDLVKVTAVFTFLADDGAVQMRAKELVNEGWRGDRSLFDRNSGPIWKTMR